MLTFALAVIELTEAEKVRMLESRSLGVSVQKFRS